MDSSAARIPLPGATMALAMFLNSSSCLGVKYCGKTGMFTLQKKLHEHKQEINEKWLIHSRYLPWLSACINSAWQLLNKRKTGYRWHIPCNTTKLVCKLTNKSSLKQPWHVLPKEFIKWSREYVKDNRCTRIRVHSESRNSPFICKL